MIDKKEVFSQYYEVFWVIHQNYDIADDAKTLGNKIDGHNIDTDNNIFDLNYGDICVTVTKIPGSIPKVSDVFEYWVGNGFYLMNIRE